jgi:ferric-dicitrate binding protein FerR (iron transport regulator)
MMAAPVPAKPLDDAALQAKRRRRRSVALALALFAAVIIFYVLTIVKMGPAIFDRAL